MKFVRPQITYAIPELMLEYQVVWVAKELKRRGMEVEPDYLRRVELAMHRIKAMTHVR